MTNWRNTRVGKLFAQAQKSDKKGMENKEKEPTFQENISEQNKAENSSKMHEELNAIPGEEPSNATETGPEAIKGDQANNADEIETLQLKLSDLNDKYLRLFSEFDNYRKRTAKEKTDLIKTAGEDIFKSILPVLDDFERGFKMMQTASDVESLRQGVELVYNKLQATLTQKGLEPMTSLDTEFNADIMEAITNFQVEDVSKKGKVIEELEKGYSLNGKVIRFAKVVVGS
jgi:molecular chaperone GrpE